MAISTLLGLTLFNKDYVTHHVKHYYHHTIDAHGMGASFYCPALTHAFSIGAILNQIAPVGCGLIQQYKNTGLNPYAELINGDSCR
jgi:hypothetical protein